MKTTLNLPPINLNLVDAKKFPKNALGRIYSWPNEPKYVGTLVTKKGHLIVSLSDYGGDIWTIPNDENYMIEILPSGTKIILEQE